MAIIANNIVVTPTKIEPAVSVDTVARERLETPVSETFDKSETKLVHNGKVKTISKKSAFLLDMLTLDDE